MTRGESGTPIYSVYGLRVRTSCPVPGLFPAPYGDGSCDLEVNFKPGEVVPVLPDEGQAYAGPNLTVLASLDCFRFSYSDGTEFLVSRDGRRVSVWQPASLTLEDSVAYLVGPVLGFVLRLRGRVCLHASSIVLGESAIGFAGPWGAGKSTIAAAFLLAGYRVLADDILALRLDVEAGRFSVEPGCTRLRLWQESEELLFRGRRSLPHWSPNWDKRFLELGKGFCPKAKELGGVVMLNRSGETTPLSLRKMSSSEAMMALVSNSYSNYLLDSEMRRQEFEILGRLVGCVEVNELTFGSGVPDVEEIIELLGS